MGLLAYLKRNRITLLKILIFIVVIYYLVSLVIQLTSSFFENIFNIITLTYLIIIIIFNLVSEFSPYLLNNCLLFIFPFLSNYYGRGAIYILVGVVSISPELNNYLNYGGYMLLGIGVLCIYTNCKIDIDFKLEYQDFEVMKQNYQDFNDDSRRESFVFPKLKKNYTKYENNNDNELIIDMDKYNKQNIEMSEIKNEL